MRTGAVRCAAGVYCALVGSLMLVAPHRLAVLPLVFFDTGLPIWGVAFLLAGIVQLASLALPIRRSAALLAHLTAMGLLGAMAVSLALDQIWAGAVMFGSLVAGLACARLVPGILSSTHGVLGTLAIYGREPTPSVREPSAGTAVPRILVAEDNVVNQRVVVRMLERPGHRVDVVANGMEAVDAATRLTYAAILMDCQMPEMDGYEATVMIRSREAVAAEQGGRRLPIIALTANAMADDRARCLAAGMDEYLAKPLRPQVLAITLERCLHQAVSIADQGQHAACSRMAG